MVPPRNPRTGATDEGLPVLLAWAGVENGQVPEAAALLPANPPLREVGLTRSTPFYLPRMMFGFLLLAPAVRAAQTLDVYVLDVEGGKSVLMVSPSVESLQVRCRVAGIQRARRGSDLASHEGRGA